MSCRSVQNVPDNDGGRFSCCHIPTRLVCNLLWNNFHLNTVCGSFSNYLFWHTNFASFNTDPPVKFLIVIILVVQEINFVLQE